MMHMRPRIKSKYHVENLPGEGIFLLSENEQHVLEGRSMLRIVPLLDGSKTWSELASAVEGQLSRDEALQAFDVLVQNSHVEDAAAALEPHFQAFWSELGKSGAEARRLVATTNVRVRTVGAVDASTIEQSLRSFGFSRDEGKPDSITIVLTDDYQQPALRAINAECLSHGTPWILVKTAGLVPLVGPFMLPGRTACWQCLESRLKHNREVESYIQRKKGLEAPFPTTRMRVPLAEAQLASVTVIQLVRWLATGHNPELESRILSLDVLTAAQRSHLVLRRPQCPACGKPELARVGGRPLVLHSQILTARGGNGLRAEAPEATFARYSHHVSEYTGVIKGIFPDPHNTEGPLKVYLAGHNFALKNDDLHFIKDGLRSCSSGKGRSDAQARTSALCEALERFSGLYRGEEECRRASYVELGADAVDPRAVTLYSERQYDEREAWLGRGRFQIVPRRFDERASISWSPLWSWTEQRLKYLPTSQLYYGFQDSPEKFFFWGDSNGNAAGSCLEDAILQGFLELVERDAVALWWYNRLRRPAVALDSLQDPYVDELRSFYAAKKRRFWVLDLTSDLGIPAFAAINKRLDGPSEDIILGFGAHLDARIAISRALTEMNQFMPAVLNVDPQGNTRYAFGDQATLEWWRSGKSGEQTYLLPADAPERSLAELPSAGHQDVKVHLEDCFSRVHALGLEVLVLDQTRPDIGIPVAKVVVPGLRHFWARFAPGRLYDVPVKMGWSQQQLAEDQLNPIAMFV